MSKHPYLSVVTSWYDYMGQLLLKWENFVQQFSDKFNLIKCNNILHLWTETNGYTVCVQQRAKSCHAVARAKDSTSPRVRQITEWMGGFEKAQIRLWVTQQECDEPAEWLLLWAHNKHWQAQTTSQADTNHIQCSHVRALKWQHTFWISGDTFAWGGSHLSVKCKKLVCTLSQLALTHAPGCMYI